MIPWFFSEKLPAGFVTPRVANKVLFLGLLWNITIFNKEIPPSLIKIKNHKKHSPAIIFHNHHHLISHQPSIFMTFHGLSNQCQCAIIREGLFPGSWWNPNDLCGKKAIYGNEKDAKNVIFQKQENKFDLVMVFHLFFTDLWKYLFISFPGVQLFYSFPGGYIHNPMPPTN